ncbi:MAG TPA: cation:proton antiporter [Segeticoccus sp.]|uniref:cation:proton antiporter n=1 Tax=Segeticoccus sp. TaxID=2706531 RepID=UPI002D7FECAA|nr:cation:proton antiporter [Segeticoccus sp.]HET8601620.1 cation:proton antiporter [Segeticoccus sp.]
MTVLLTAAILIAGVVSLTPLSDRVGVPQPILLSVFGLLLALVPGVPNLDIAPQLILPVVLPPLLFAATQRTTVREFRENARPVVLLAVGLTAATAFVVAAVAHAMGLAWGPSWVLGAIVSPPDPVAATAVSRRLRLPHRLVTVLEGEGMFNDATALVIYQVAVGAVVTAHLSAGHVVVELVLAVGVGIGLGIAVGWVTKLILAALHDGPSETTVTAVMPFAVYLLAEQLHGSGVLAVLALGLYLRSFAHRATTAGGYLLGRSVWRFADFVITSLVFALIGFELTGLLGRSSLTRPALLTAAAVIGAVVVFRGVWLYPAAWFARWHRRRQESQAPYGWRETTVVAWAGMRGVVSVATTLALPMAVAGGSGFPGRAVITLTALCCVLVTLLGQGLTLAPIVSFLRVGADYDVPGEVARLRREATSAALEALRTSSDDELPASVRAAAVQQYEGYLGAQSALEFAVSPAEDAEEPVEALRRALSLAADIERDVILTARRNGRVSVAAADQVLDDIEARASRGIA